MGDEGGAQRVGVLHEAALVGKKGTEHLGGNEESMISFPVPHTPLHGQQPGSLYCHLGYTKATQQQQQQQPASQPASQQQQQ